MKSHLKDGVIDCGGNLGCREVLGKSHIKDNRWGFGKEFCLKLGR